MKSKIALLLTVVMLASCLFVFPAFAEGESAPVSDPTYESVEIAYANLNYSDKIYMMFAVPVYADLPADAKVELVVWDDAESTTTFSYNDSISTESSAPVAVVIEANAEKASIGGKDHLVFVYDALTAEQMTDVIYARPVITLADGKRVYGDVISYSILEYVKTAKGEMGVEGLKDQNTLDLLDSMLDFGALAQNYLGDGEAYLPNGFYANDTLSKIWITPVFDGVPGEKIFGGFFKAEVGAYAALYAPAFDLYTAVEWLNSAGEVIEDADLDADTPHFTVVSAEGDLEVKLVYSRKMVFDSTIENADFGEFFQKSGASTMHQTTANQRVEMVSASLAGNSGSGPNPGQVDKNGACTAKNCYTSYKVIEDPHKPGSGEKVLLWTGTDNGALYMDGTNSPIKIKSKVAGIGDTIDPVFTIDFTIAGGELAVGSTANFRFRSDYLKAATGTGTAQCNLNIFKITGGKVQIATSDSKYVDLCELSTTSYTRFVITIDFAAETIRGYVADENGELNLVVEETQRTRPAAMATAAAVVDESGNPRNVGYDSLYNWLMNAQSKVEWYGGGGSALSNDKLKTLTVDIDGVQTPLADANGVINEAAFIKWHELNESLIIKDVKMYAGDVE